MANYEIKCKDCDQPIAHICHEDFKEALIRFLSWAPEGMWASGEMAAAFKQENEKQGNNYDFQKYPFFGSQAWSYLIWYKEDARSFHGVMDNMIRAAGFDPYQIRLEISQKRKKEEDERKELEDRRAKRKMAKVNEQ